MRCQNAVHEDRYLDHALATALDLRQLHALAIAARILESPPGTEVGDRASGSPGPGELPID